MTEELYRGRSIISGIPTKLVLIRWKKPETCSMTVIGEGKDEQKCSTIRLRDLVCMTKEEATRHEKEIFKADKSLTGLYDEETINMAFNTHGARPITFKIETIP
ncbi:hypothetical protein TrVFT333_009671 [Trichoderma virens FT-333]|nr:hypothetical protein TrVFT333_009671 [Trichoderma virens FT-333]